MEAWSREVVAPVATRDVLVLPAETTNMCGCAVDCLHLTGLLSQCSALCCRHPWQIQPDRDPAQHMPPPRRERAIAGVYVAEVDVDKTGTNCRVRLLGTRGQIDAARALIHTLVGPQSQEGGAPSPTSIDGYMDR